MKFSQHIHSNEHALAVGCLTMDECMNLQLHKDGGSANKLWRFHKDWQLSTVTIKAYRANLLFKCLEVVLVKAVAVYLKFKEQFVKFPSGNHAMCLLLKITLWRHFAQWKLSWLGWDFEMGAVERQLLFTERCTSRAWQSGQKSLDMWANSVVKHCLSLKIFHS